MAQLTSVLQERREKLSWRMSPQMRRNFANGLLFVSPWLIGLLVLTLYPIIASLYYSFTTYGIVDDPKWVGFDNYYKLLFNDHLFWKSVSNTLYFAAVSVPLGLVLGIAVALLLNRKVWGMAVYRTVFYLPSIVPEVATAMLWVWILNPQFGLLNAMLRSVGLPTLGWLTDPQWSKPSLILMGLWKIGASMVIYLAALQDVPQSLYEAAELDGAGALGKLRHVTLPLITPTIFFDLVMGLIGTFQYFTTVYVISGGDGGPVDSTLFYGLLLYRNAFTYLKMGYASAMAWFLFIFVLIVTMFLFKTSGRWVYYQGDNRS
jgi:multiple sugar transport system permease protein